MLNNVEDFPQDVFAKLCTLSKIAYDAILKEKFVFYQHQLPEGFEHMSFTNECRELAVCGPRHGIKLQLHSPKPSRISCCLAYITVTKHVHTADNIILKGNCVYNRH